MSDTPRTDALAVKYTAHRSVEHYGAMRTLARELERENAELMAALRQICDAANFRDAAFTSGDDIQQDAAVSMFMRAENDALDALAKAESHAP